MARNFASANSERVDWTPAAFITTTMSVAYWIRYTSLPSSGNFMGSFSFGRGPGNDWRNLCIDLRNNAGTYTYRVVWTSGGGTYQVYEGTVTPSTATWYHVCATADWTTNPDTIALYVDGSSVGLTQTSGTDNSTPDSTAPVQGSWGCLNTNGSPTLYLNGDLAEGAIWTAALNAGEVLALSKGQAPALVRSASLINNPSFLGGVNDRVFGPLTDVNSTTDTDHPPKIMYPRRRTFTLVADAAPPAEAGGSSGYKPFKGPFGHPFNVPF